MPIQLMKDYIDNLGIIMGCQGTSGDELFSDEQTSGSAGANGVGENRRHWRDLPTRLSGQQQW